MYRAVQICNNHRILQRKFHKIIKLLQQNGYPLKIVQNTIRNLLNKNNKAKKVPVNEQNSVKPT